LCFYGHLACWYTIFAISCIESEFNTKPEWKQETTLVSFLYFAKMWDLLVGNAMIAFFGWNCYVAMSGLTYLEYKNLLETNSRIVNKEINGEPEVK